MPTYDELVVFVFFLYFFALIALGFSLYNFVCLDKHLSKHKQKKKDNEIIEKTRSVVFDDLCEYFEHAGRSYHNESEFKKR